MRPAGRFIVLEGGEGAGKTTVLTSISRRLRDSGIEVVETREPGGTTLGERIRALILDAAVPDPLAELLLFEAARAHLVASVVRPALERGATVLCDRFAASSLAYQGAGRGLDAAVVWRANELAMQGVRPDITLLLDVPVGVGLARRQRTGEANHFDRETVAFHERVRAAFLEFATDPSWHIIDASGSEDEVAAQAWEAIRPR